MTIFNASQGEKGAWASRPHFHRVKQVEATLCRLAKHQGFIVKWLWLLAAVRAFGILPNGRRAKSNSH